MAKIFSILTLLAAGLALYLGLESGKRVKELQSAGERIKGRLSQTETDLTRTKDTLKTTSEELATNKADLETTRAKMATAEQEATKAKADYTTTKTELDRVNGEVDQIKKAIEEVLPGKGLQGITELKNSINELNTKVKDYETKIGKLEGDVATHNAEKEQMMAKEKELSDQIANRERTIKRYTEGIMEKGIRGRVMAVNSGWGFAVLSIGDRQGAAANKVMIVARNGQAIGKVRITNVEATQSVADILPGTFVRGTYIQPGDTVIYTGEDKVQPEEAEPETPATSTPPPSTPSTAQPTLPQI